MVVRLTPARRATSSSATRRKPCCSNSTTAALRIAWVAGSTGLTGLSAGITFSSKTVVAQSHRQMVPQPVHRPRPPHGGEPLIAAFLTLTPGQAEQSAGPRRHTAGGQERRDRIEHRRQNSPRQRRDTFGAGKSFSHISHTVFRGGVRDHDPLHHVIPVPLELVVVSRHRPLADAVAAVPGL